MSAWSSVLSVIPDLATDTRRRWSRRRSLTRSRLGSRSKSEDTLRPPQVPVGSSTTLLPSLRRSSGESVSRRTSLHHARLPVLSVIAPRLAPRARVLRQTHPEGQLRESTLRLLRPEHLRPDALQLLKSLQAAPSRLLIRLYTSHVTTTLDFGARDAGHSTTTYSYSLTYTYIDSLIPSIVCYTCAILYFYDPSCAVPMYRRPLFLCCIIRASHSSLHTATIEQEPPC